MRFEIQTHPEALEELEEAVRYLDERTLWVADDLVETYDKAVENIRSHPERCHFIYREFRRCHLKRFPYSVIYRQQDDEVFVIAVMHDKRHPDYWKHRIPSS